MQGAERAKGAIRNYAQMNEHLLMATRCYARHHECSMLEAILRATSRGLSHGNQFVEHKWLAIQPRPAWGASQRRDDSRFSESKGHHRNARLLRATSVLTERNRSGDGIPASSQAPAATPHTPVASGCRHVFTPRRDILGSRYRRLSYDLLAVRVAEGGVRSGDTSEIPAATGKARVARAFRRTRTTAMSAVRAAVS